MRRIRFTRAGALVLSALALMFLFAVALGKDEAAKSDDKGKGGAAGKALRVAILPPINRSAESLALDTINEALKSKVKALPPEKGTFILPDDAMRVLDQAGETDRGLRVTERWAKDGVLDSTALDGLDSLLLADAVLCVKVSEFEVKRITQIGAGESYTTIGLQFALFDLRDKKRLWSKEVREQRAAPAMEGSVGSVSYDETGHIESRTANQPPRPKDVAEDLILSAFKNFPKK
jgi:hypothetical protein